MILAGVSMLVLISFLMGVALFVSYYKAIRNLVNYDKVMREIRVYWWKTYSLSIRRVDSYRSDAWGGKHEAEGLEKRSYRKLLFALGLIFIVGNTLLLSLLVGLVF